MTAGCGFQKLQTRELWWPAESVLDSLTCFSFLFGATRLMPSSMFLCPLSGTHICPLGRVGPTKIVVAQILDHVGPRHDYLTVRVGFEG